MAAFMKETNKTEGLGGSRKWTSISRQMPWRWGPKEERGRLNSTGRTFLDDVGHKGEEIFVHLGFDS